MCMVGRKLSRGVHPSSVGSSLLSSLMGSSICQLIVCLVPLEYIVVVLESSTSIFSLQIYAYNVPITFPSRSHIKMSGQFVSF